MLNFKADFTIFAQLQENHESQDTGITFLGTKLYTYCFFQKGMNAAYDVNLLGGHYHLILTSFLY